MWVPDYSYYATQSEGEAWRIDELAVAPGVWVELYMLTASSTTTACHQIRLVSGRCLHLWFFVTHAFFDEGNAKES